MTDTIASLDPKDVQLSDDVLKKIFLEHLNYIYFGKHHLIHFFNEIKDIATLKVLQDTIQAAIDDTVSQLTQMDRVFNLTKQKPSRTSTLSIKATTLEAYLKTIKAGKTPLEQDVFILFYLQQIEGIEVTYFTVLKNLAQAIGYSDTFVEKPFNDAVENNILFESIYKEYIN